MSADEKSVGKGHNYLTLIYDLDGATVEHIEDGRRKESLDGYFCLLTPHQRAKIEAIAMDIWDPYLASIREHVPAAAAKLVFDRYHPMTHMVKIVDSVRKQEHWEMKNEGNDILTETKCLWLYSRENVPERRRRMFSALRKMRLRTARAWALKEDLRALWAYRPSAWAMKHVEAWYGWAICSRLKPGKAVARMFWKDLTNILTFLKHRITNAVSEGLNSTIQTIKKTAYGFHNCDHFKIAILFSLRGLKPLPRHP